MPEISCAAAGHSACNAVVRGATEEELKRNMTDHARKRHNVQQMTDTIYNFLRNSATRG
ncbi:MAG TPA: DUF1059 domain-containing protein [Acidimicrobiales bacterium]|nr:DUF1059 domain-containing protein [Acidimicrobiales bacterium]